MPKEQQNGKDGETPDIFVRLESRGIPAMEYAAIKKIVTFDIPQFPLLYSRQFGRRPIKQVLDQIDRWRELLEQDFLMLEKQRAEIERMIAATEIVVWQTLLSQNLPQIGPWQVQISSIPTGWKEDGSPQFIQPGERILAVHEATGETREAIISAEKANDPRLCAKAYREAFENLGLYELLDRGPMQPRLVSAREPQGWPVFTQFVVPRLYDFLVPYYRKQAHYSEQRDQGATKVERTALYPRELLEDMLAILQMEHPTFFSEATTSQLKGVIQRHLDRIAGTHSPK